MNRLVALILGAMVCFGVVEYAPMRAWLTDYQNRKEMVEYAQTVSEIGNGPLTEVGGAALQYNEQLLAGTLEFPGERLDRYYLKQLKTGTTAMIGHVDYDALDIHIPLALTTNDSVLAKGAGHLYTTGLPVGGEGNRPILSAHSGLVNARGFSPLVHAELGQVFSVTTAVGTLWYEVDDIETVLPWEVEKIDAVPGQDLVTLMTCTPIGQNTHRLLVTGHRIAGPLHPEPQILSFWVWPGPPWPLIWWAGAVALTAGAGKYFYIVRPAKKAAATAAALASAATLIPTSLQPEFQGA